MPAALARATATQLLERVSARYGGKAQVVGDFNGRIDELERAFLAGRKRQ